MALTHFYLQSGASDLNAGSTTGAAASLTYAGGTFVRSTCTFTVASGDPVADGVIVGDWVSVYTTSGAVSATFVMQVASRTTTTIVGSTTVVMGLATSVSETAAASTAKVGGAWASEIVLAATGLGTFTVPASTKINIKAATYTVVANRTVSMAGTTTKPIWYSFYNTTPGDLDTDTTNALSKPVFSLNSTVTMTASGAYQMWSGLSVTGSVNGFLWTASSSPGTYVRCRFENTNSGAATLAFVLSGVQRVAYCWFKTPVTATTNGCCFSNGTAVLVGNVAEGGGHSGFNMTGTTVMEQCVALNNTGQGMTMASAFYVVSHCTVYNATADGIRCTTVSGTQMVISSCLFDTCGGWGINNNTGTNTANIARFCNDFRACTSGTETGFGDMPSLFGQTDGSAVVTSATDMTPVVGSNARNNGFPGKFENQSYSSYLDIGAVEHVDPSGGSGGVMFHPGMNGGMS